jgi:hypothetical protein
LVTGWADPRTVSGLANAPFTQVAAVLMRSPMVGSDVGLGAVESSVAEDGSDLLA